MKISKLYANNDNFKTIVFDKGINFILSDSNGVGKTSPFDGDKNTYEKGIYNAIHQLDRIGIQTIIPLNEDAIKNQEIF